MNQLQKRPRRWLAWFIAGLLSTFVLAGLPFIGQPASATMNPPMEPAQLDVPTTQPAPLQTPFVDIVATHQEPNFYD